MALSEPVFPDTDQGELVVGQDYLACGTKDCGKSCQFYCNHCHLPMCKECRDGHQENPKTIKHRVVFYSQRKRKLPEEKCKDHPTKDIDILCEDCQIPVCSKCATQNHRKHVLSDLETLYSENFSSCRDKVHKIYQYLIPTAQDEQKNIKEDFKELKSTMGEIIKSMKTEGEILKCVVDIVISENIEQVSKIEKSLKEMLQCQDKTYQDYISNLEELVNEFHCYMSFTKVQNNPIIYSLDDRLTVQPIPDTTKPVPPVFTAGQYKKEDVAKLLGRVTVPDTKLENRKIKLMETVFTQFKSTEKQRKCDREKSDVQQTLSLSSSVIKVREYTVPGVNSVCHISLSKSGRLWGSDSKGNLVQTDLQGNQLQKIQTSSEYGYHTVTRDGDLTYTNKENKVINMITLDNTITEFVKTGDWEPLSIHSSNINGDMLVGMIRVGEAKVTRYNKTGKEIQNIQRDNEGQGLYDYPHYITENINGDICTSDWNKRALVVVNKSGQHRFSYTGQGSEFYPRGIYTDLLSHILVCNSLVLDFLMKPGSNTIHLLDQDGQFLSLLLTEQPDIKCPCSLCVDDENNIHVGQWNTDTVTVYKNIQ